jgi:hypothetical protein
VSVPSWQAWRLELKAVSPLHLGWHSLGTITRTRYYLPARVLWGTLVSGLAQRLPGAGKVPQMYTSAEMLANQTLRFTPFFPFIGGPAVHVLRPRYCSRQGLMYGTWSPSEFEHCFVSSYASTALNPDTLGHEDGALHESEFLCPTGQDAGSTPLEFMGYVFLRGPLDQNLVFDTLRECWVGGDRKSGFGALKLKGTPVLANEIFGDFKFANLDRAESPLLVPRVPDATFPAHVICQAGIDGQVKGDFEVVVGREWSDRGSGQKIGEPGVCWVPGSRLTAVGNRVPKFEITSKGHWRIND